MNIFPYSNFHDLNLDWLLQQVKQLRTDVDGLIGSATPSNTAPQMDGAGAPGVSVNYSRGDHQHPTDTSRASATALADEVTARTNKDLSLDSDIAAVDAKIHFSASNPLMDGSATAGFSTDQARADHIHPTDTSRAAAADLTQEISDRGNADITLQNNINAVDAKIVLATGAPLMDSSSATPGSSTSMARADHVHPTDTSRASATDLATLQARVDSFTGSAIASDATPQMDGVGSAGTGGNYSRGDHVHPSDTTKVNKAGDTMTGYLENTEEEQHILGINSIGWVRIADVPQEVGNLAVFNIVKKGNVTPGESHEIRLNILQNSIAFTHEVSKSDVLYITKIRYSNAGKVDIYVDQNYTSDIGIYLQRCASTLEKVENIKLITPTGVDASPIGETILTTYDFTANTSGQASTPTAGTHATINAGSNVYKEGKIVYGRISVSTNALLSAGGWKNLALIEAGYRPAADYDSVLINNATDNPLHLRILTDGNVNIYPNANIPMGVVLIACFTYYSN